MSKKCALSFKKDREGFCNTIVNGKLRVKQTARIEKTLAVEDNLQVYNDANIGDTVNTCNITIKNQLIYSEPELINESGETLSQLKTLSFINTSGTGILEDGCCNGLYKKIIMIDDATENIWKTLSDINGNVNVIAFDEFNNDEGPYIGGDFTSVNGNTALKYLAKYDISSSSWTSVKSGGDNISGTEVNTIAFGPSGDGPYIGGDFGSVDSVLNTLGISKWTGSSWTSIGLFNDNVNIIKFDNNNVIHVGGDFNSPQNKLTKYDSGSSSWTSVKSGGDSINQEIIALSFDTNNNVYIGGDFTSVDSISSLKYIAKYDISSSSWTSVNPAGDIIDPSPFGRTVEDIAFNPITGEGPYIAGGMNEINGTLNFDRFAKWGGTSIGWTSLKSGGDNFSGKTLSIAFKSNGDGPYVGGAYAQVDSNPDISFLAYWNGSGWTSVKSGGDNVDLRVNTVSFSPSGTGPYIGGNFTEVGGETANAKFAYYGETGAEYELTYNTTETLTLTNKGDEATFVYNTNPTNSWIKLT